MRSRLCRSNPLRALPLLLVPCLWNLGALPADAHGGVIGWGRRVFDSGWNRQAFAQVSAGTGHTAGLHTDGSVVVWGENMLGACMIPKPPPGLTYVEAAAGND